MNLTRDLVKDLGVLWAFGLSVLLFAIWAAAYASPNRAVTISINTLGEAQLELLVWTIVVPILTLALHYYVEDEVRGD